MSPDPLKPGPKSETWSYLNYYIMQSTGHETQTMKPGHIPLITLPKELLISPSGFTFKNHPVALCRN